MKKLIIPSIMATLLLLASCDKGNDLILPEPEPTPEPAPEPDKPKTMLCFSTSIEMLNEVTTRGTVSTLVTVVLMAASMETSASARNPAKARLPPL